MANGAAFYKSVDGRLGLTSGTTVPLAAGTLWAGGVTWAAKAVIQNGGFIFQTTSGGAGNASGVGPTPRALTDNSCTWTLVGPCSPFCVSDATQILPLGTIALGRDFGPNDYGEAEFQYVKFTGSSDVTAGDWCTFDSQGKTCTPSATASPGAGKVTNYGIAMGSQKLSTTTPLYGWVMIRGIFDGAHMGTTFTAGCTISGIATAGACESKASTWALSNYLIDGAVLRAGSTDGLCTVELRWPACSGR